MKYLFCFALLTITCRAGDTFSISGSSGTTTILSNSTLAAQTVFNAKYYGAKGDGVTDDTVAVTNMVNSMTSGGIAFFPPGTYMLNNGIWVTNSNVAFTGVAQVDYQTTGGTILKWSTMGTDYGNTNGIMVYGVRNFRAENLKLIGPPGYQGIPSSGIALYYDGPVTVRNVSIINFNYDLLAESSGESRIEDCHFDNCGINSVWFNNCNWITCVGNIFSNAGNAGSGGRGENIHVSGLSHGISFYDSTVDEAWSTCVWITDTASDISLNNCTIYAPNHGIGVKTDSGTARVMLNNVRVDTFHLGNSPTNTIVLYGTGHTMFNVTDVPSGGNGIQDSATNTVWINVDGTNKFTGPMTITNVVDTPLLVLNQKSGASADIFQANIGTSAFRVLSSGQIITPGRITASEFFDNASVYISQVAVNGIELNNVTLFGWSSDGTPYGTKDVGFARDSAGVLRLSNGSSGTAALKASSILFGTNILSFSGTGLTWNGTTITVP